MNNALTHTSASLPTLSYTDGHIVILSDDCDPEEVTRTDILAPSTTSDDKAENWCDGLTMFALFLTFIGFMGMIAQDVGEKASASHQARVRLDQNCLLTYK